MGYLFWIESGLAIFMLGAAVSFPFILVFGKQFSWENVLFLKKPLSPIWINKGSILSFRQMSLWKWPPGPIEPFKKGRLCQKVF
jgi:hypothetical protein